LYSVTVVVCIFSLKYRRTTQKFVHLTKILQRFNFRRLPMITNAGKVGKFRLDLTISVFWLYVRGWVKIVGAKFPISKFWDGGGGIVGGKISNATCYSVHTKLFSFI